MKLRLFFTLATLCTLIGCVDNYNEQCTAEKFSIRAIIENEETRTVVTDDGNFSWSLGDKVWLQTSTGSAIGNVIPSENPKIATISSGQSVSEITGIAIFPYNENHKATKVFLPSSYDLESNINETNAIMYGTIVDGEMKFVHLAGVMRFKFTDVPKGVNKFELTLDKKVNGEFSVNTSNLIVETRETTEKSERTITLNFSPLESKTDICINIPLPVGTYNGLYFTLSDSNGVIWRYSNTVTNVVERKSLILMPSISIDVPEAPYGYTNLSSNGTANCYIVSESGKYCFRLIKGNGMMKITNATKAEVLWESRNYGTFNAGDFIKQVNLQDDFITFETPGNFKEGNALIAVKDSNDTILWSWHIWLTDNPKELSYYGNAGVMMDRNIGAMDVYDLDGLGMMYQWGRKDPFLPSRKFMKGNSEVISSTGSFKYIESDETTGTIQYTIENPTTFIEAPFVDWLYGSDLGINDSRWSNFKTIYDPCPPGWRVPDSTIWMTALNKKPSLQDPNCTIDITFVSRPYDRGINIKFGDEISWYPAQGHKRSANTVSDSGYFGNYWSCNSTKYNDLAFALLYSSSSEKCDLKCSTAKVQGFPVRCMKE